MEAGRPDNDQILKLAQTLKEAPFWYLFRIWERVEKFGRDYSGFGSITFKIELKDGQPYRMVCEREEESVMPDTKR